MTEEWMNDARKIPDEAMSYIREMAVRAIEEEEFSPESVAEVFHISRTAIYAWLRRYRDGGCPALETQKPAGTSSDVTESMENWLGDIVLGSSPQDFGYETALWTRDILAEILGDEFDLEIAGSTVGKHLRKMGFSYQKPWFQARERDPDKVEHFLNDTFPRIQRLAEKISADIGFEDEAGAGLQTHSGRTWGKAGITPEVAVSSKHGGFNLLSMVTGDGVLRFSIKEGKINSERYIEFLSDLIGRRKRPLILIADRARFHYSSKVREFVRSHREKIRMYFLPPYSPEMNPSEQVWNDLKDKKIGRMAIKTTAELKRALYSIMRGLQHHVTKVRSFFDLPDTKYAALECGDF